MKGYVFLDMGGNLSVRYQDYIDNEDPGFFQRNRHTVVLVWKFDTDNEGGMYELLSSFSRRQLPMATVKEFARQAGFDLESFLKKYQKEKTVFSLPKEI